MHRNGNGGKDMHQNVKTRSTTVFFGILVLLLATATLVFGQGGNTGAVAGTIQDPSGAVVSGAQIEVINQSTGLKERTLTSGSNGTFNAPLLPIGHYTLVVSKEGFARTEAPDLVVRVTETTRVNIQMKLGAVTEEVTVSGVSSQVQLAAPTTGQTLTGDVIVEMPLATRNFLTLLALSAGTNTEMGGGAALGRGAVTLTVNGQRAVNNNYQLEGVNANDINLPIFDNVALPNPDTVAEFKTQTSLYDASQGRNGGGNIQVALRSGTDKYHGSAYEFFRNNVLNANEWFHKRNQLVESKPNETPVLRQNKFGGSLGGPVPLIKNFWFFGNYEGTRAASGISTGTNFTTNIPVLPADRSEANLIATFFPSGLPSGFSNLDPVALAYMNLPASKCPLFNDGQFCIPSLPGTPGFGASGTLNKAQISRSSLGVYDEDQFTITMDKQLGSSDKISGRWFYSKFNTVQPFSTQATLPFQKDFPQLNRFLKLGWTHTISTTGVNEFRFGFSRFGFDQVPHEPILLSDIGAVRGNSAEFPAAFRIAISGIGFSLGTGVNDDRGGRFNTFYYADDLSTTHGKHTLRVGGDISRYQLNRFNHFATRGSVSFANTTSTAPSLVGFQNFLLGRVTSTQGGAGFFTFHFRATDYAAYVQDDWKVHKRLTLNLGVRYEGLSVAHEKQNFLSNFRGLGDGNPGPISIIHPEDTPRVGTTGVPNCTLKDCLAHKLGPRAGFAWDVFGDQKTALRGGYGLYYQRTSNQELLQSAGGQPFSQQVSAQAFTVTLQNPFPTILPDSAFPLPNDQVVPRLVAFDGATGAPVFQSSSGAPLSGFFFFPSRNFHPPRAEQWNLTFQRELFKSWVWEVGYVGTRGGDLVGPGRPLNAGRICTLSQPCIIPNNIAAGVTVPAGTPGVVANADGTISITSNYFCSNPATTPCVSDTNAASNIDARVPTQFLGLANSRGFFQENLGESEYHSLQTTLVHQFSKSLYFQAAYTYSKSIDNGSGSAFQDELNGLFQFGDLLNTKSNHGLSDFDRTHRVVFSYDYDLPFARLAHIDNHGLGKLANGWRLIGNTTFQSGTPFVIVDSSAVTLQDTDFVNTTNFATLAPGMTKADVLNKGSRNSKIDNFLNMSAFQVGGSCVNDQNVVVASSDPTCTGFAAVGNVQRNSFRGLFQQNWNLSLAKATSLTEKVSLDFRADFFNIFNHPVFGSPQYLGGSSGNYGYVDVSGGDSSILNTVNDPRILQFSLKLSF
jgi:carboxypeptidase family protein/TonB-dependent receptor-like protein